MGDWRVIERCDGDRNHGLGSRTFRRIGAIGETRWAVVVGRRREANVAVAGKRDATVASTVDLPND